MWKAAWASTDNFTDTVLVDLSGLASGYTKSLTIKKITCATTANIDLTFEFDATSDQLVLYHNGGMQVYTYDFTGLPDGGVVKDASGTTGDLVLTTANAASGEEVYIMVEWRAD
jgi:hypothetical protein